MTARTPDLDRRKENKVGLICSEVVNWTWQLKYHKKGDLRIRQLRGNMDITDWELLDSKLCR